MLYQGARLSCLIVNVRVFIFGPLLHITWPTTLARYRYAAAPIGWRPKCSSQGCTVYLQTSSRLASFWAK
jgi:hypothetical protein